MLKFATRLQLTQYQEKQQRTVGVKTRNGNNYFHFPPGDVVVTDGEANFDELIIDHWKHLIKLVNAFRQRAPSDRQIISLG